jgi:hypothetical protein
MKEVERKKHMKREFEVNTKPIYIIILKYKCILCLITLNYLFYKAKDMEKQVALSQKLLGEIRTGIQLKPV